MNNIIKTIILCLLIFPSFVLAYPVTEKTPDSGTAPLEILSSQPDRIYTITTGDYANQYLFPLDTSSYYLTFIDLNTWDEKTVQPDIFNSCVSDVTLLADGTTLIVGLSSGNIATLDLDDEDSFENTEAADTTDNDDEDDDEDDEEDPEDSRETEISENMTEPGISFLVADPVDDIIYMVNDSGYYFQYNINTNTLTETLLVDDGATTTTTDDDDTTTQNYYTPTDMVYAESSGGDKILISTASGDVLVITPGETEYTVYTLSSSAESVDTENPNFSDMALTPDNDYAFLVDSDNDLIWVFHVVSEAFKDQQSSGTSLDPIEMDDTDDNNTFTHIYVYEDDSENVVAYVSGANGLTLIDASEPGTASSESKVIDNDDSDSDEDPLTLSGTPGPLSATTTEAGYVFTFNGDASISVLTDNPWVSITSISADTLTTSEGTTFDITFQSDIAGNYTIMANSDPTAATGTELIASTAFTEIDTDITTTTIDIDTLERSSFVEGENTIFVFVTDENGLIGHSATLLSVDRPPETTTITGLSFGNQKIFVQFDKSPDEDIYGYVLYAEPATNQTAPTCPGGLSFDSDSTVSGVTYQVDCSADSCEGTVKNLTNDTAYCVAIKVVDQSNQESDLSSYTASVTPEQTVGPAGYFGETSCQLNPYKSQNKPFSFLIMFFAIMALLIVRALKKHKANVLIIFFCLLAFVTQAQAKPLQQEMTPQHWTLEPKISYWIPTDSAVKDFIGMFPHFGFEVEFGYLLKARYNFTLTTGLGYEGGQAVGQRSGGTSGDSYSLFLIPIRLDFAFRFDFKNEQLFLPYVRTGLDFVLFTESSAGSSITNYKYGFHAGVGVGILLDRIEQLGHALESEMGVNDIYLTIEARYAFLNSLSSTGLDLSGIYPYIGLLFEF